MIAKQKTSLDHIKPKMKALWRKKKFKQALDMLLEELKQGQSRRLCMWISETYFCMHNNKHAEEFALKAKSLPYTAYYPDKKIDCCLASVYTDIGYKHLIKRKNQEAIKMLIKAIALDKLMSSAYLFLGWTYSNLEEHETAIKYYDQGLNACQIQVYKKIPKKELLKTGLLSNPKAIKRFKTKDLYSELCLFKAYSLADQEMFEEAQESALNALKFLPAKGDPTEINEFLAYCNMEIENRYSFKGNEYTKKEKYQEAKVILEEGLKKVSYPVGCHIMLSEMYDCLNEHEKSLEHANKASDNVTLRSIAGIGVEKEDIAYAYALASACRGNALKELKRYEEAKEAFKESLKHTPKGEDVSYIQEELEELKWR
jgi:tetratricopeptide (TPR) repeat protein